MSEAPRRPRILLDGEEEAVPPRPVPSAPPPPVPETPFVAAEPLRGPRVVVEEVASPAAPRLDFGWEGAVVPVASVPTPGGWSAASRAAAGVAVLLLGLSALDAANFVAAQFERGAALGWLTLAVVAAGYGLILSAGWRELRGLAAVRGVERARAAFARGDLEAARAEALRWSASSEVAAAAQPAIRNAADLPTLRALLEAGPLATLDARATALGRRAAVQAFSATAVSPSPGLDALILLWRGVRLVRQVATLHGLRPGLAGTLALLRRAVFDAATVAAADLATDAAARALLSNPLLEKLAGEAASGAVAARRMLLLARTAAAACRIVPRG